MLLLLFSFIGFFIIFYGYGSLVNPLINENKSSISLTLFSGISLLIVIHSINAFFLPLNFYYECIINGIGGIIGGNYLYKNYKSLKIIINYQFFLLLILILFSASFYPYILDHFGYYVTTIKWLNEYGIVKGIANLSFILGQQSPWHILQAGFDNTIDPFLKINAYFLIIYIIYYLENKKVELLLTLPILLLYVQSPSPDISIIIFTLIIIFESIKNYNNLPFLLLLSVITFFIKPLAFGLIIWILFLIIKDKQYQYFYQKKWIYSCIFSLLITFLFIIKNYYTSGLPLFPLSFKINNPLWIVPKDFIENSKTFADLKTFDLKYSISEIDKMNSYSKFLNWLNLSGFKGVINKLFIVVLIIYFTIVLYKKQKKFIILGIISTLNVVIIYFISAQYRFMIPVFLGFIFIIIYQLNINEKLLKRSINFFSVIMIILISYPNFLQSVVPSFRLSFLMRKYELQLILKPENYASPNYKIKKIGNLIYNVPINYPYTYSIPLPGISIYEDTILKKSSSYPQLIEKNNISKGFYTKLKK